MSSNDDRTQPVEVIVLNKRTVTVSRLVEIAFKPFAAQFAEKDIKINMNLPYTLPDIECDVAKIAWVLSIFFSNAVRYTPEWGKLSVVGATKNKMLRICVENTGYGIPTESVERMFEHPENEDTNSFGQGLALLLAREIIDAHKGKLGVESELGVMTQFYFELPLNTKL
ncbi:MAG: Adaptive-response sensory-kinase SasA [Turneriella sp.]|nr:Adaptive-response sensory-kinase SasA [Turneriella sp.]